MPHEDTEGADVELYAISGILRGVNKIFTLLRRYAAQMVVSYRRRDSSSTA
jgi:hypothetical protein